MRVLIVPDKFKGTLDAAGVARAIAKGWLQARPGDEVELLPMSDGGDGFGAVVGARLGARVRRVTTVDAAGRPCRAKWWWAAKSRTAILETAQSNGLALLPRGRFHPFDLDTRGVARLLEAAVRAGARTCVLGVGGSATNDGGFGLARALGWRFTDLRVADLERWTDLDRVAFVMAPPRPPARRRIQTRYIVATDVSNPLLGPRGASRVYGPQKGLRPEDMARAEACLGGLARAMKYATGFDSRLPGCGAAGGLGYGLQAFVGAERRLGFDLFAELTGLEEKLRQADLVISGEGSFDRQSVMGKGVGQLLALARVHDKPCLVLAGRLSGLPKRLRPPLRAVRALLEITDEEQALRQPGRWLTRLSREVAEEWERG